MKIAWFSCGITSAVACKLAVETWNDVEMYYIHIDSHHSDNWRFIADCEEWIGQKINVVQSEKYKDQFDVIEQTKYINGAYGARCTKELKKEVRLKLENDLKPKNQIFGFEFSKKEINRAIRFKQQYPNTNPLFPLIEERLTKEYCAGLLMSAGIELPVMYKLGYNNNNCVGCIKGGMGYWNKIRQDFPGVFEQMARAEREVNATCIKEDSPQGGSQKVFLDQLDENRGRDLKPVVPDCGMFCQVEFTHLVDERVAKVEKGELSINQIS